MSVWLQLALTGACFTTGTYCAYRYGLSKGGDPALTPEVVEARLQASEAERAMWDITREAFERMAQAAQKR